MANLDSRSKRASSVGILLSFILALVLPDGTIADADRQHSIWTYSGIAATAAVTPAWRIATVASETRNITTAAESRSIIVAAETRSVDV